MENGIIRGLKGTESIYYVAFLLANQYSRYVTSKNSDKISRQHYVTVANTLVALRPPTSGKEGGTLPILNFQNR